MDHRVVSTSPPASSPLFNNLIAAPPAPMPAPGQRGSLIGASGSHAAAAANAAARSGMPPSSASAAGAQQQQQRRVVGDWVVETRIGSGSFATVWRGFHKTTLQAVAIKSVNKDKLQVNKKHQENLDLEIMIMQRIQHPNIVRLYDTKDTPRHKYLILEYCAGGDLSKFIRKHGAMSERVAKQFLGQLAEGLKHLRKNNLIHRDLKPQNLLLDSENADARLKIADFGFARYMEADNLAVTLCGSPLYMAPEILGYKEYDASVDLWSVGAICFEMLTGKPPFTGQNHIQLLARINSSEVKFPAGLELSASCTNLLLNLLKRNPRERITYEQFFAHPFVVEAMALAQASLRKQEADMLAQAEALVLQQQQAAQQPQQHQPAAAYPSSPSILAAASTSPSAESISKSLVPSGSSPSLAMQQQREQHHQQRNSLLYGSSPSQHSFAQHHPAHGTSPHRNSPVLPSSLPSNSPPSPSFLPTQHNHAQNQTYQRPPQQQVGFNTTQQPPPQPHSQHQNRPISRHNTPQNLRGSGDGSTSIEREYVVVDRDANSHSQGLAGQQRESSPLHQQQQQQSPVPAWSAADFAAERQRFVELFKRISLTVKLADKHARFAASACAGGFLSSGQDAEQALMNHLLTELHLSAEDNGSVSALGGSVAASAIAAPSGVLHFLANALSLYVKAIEQFSDAQASLQSVLALAESSPALKQEDRDDWRGINGHFTSNCDQQMDKARSVQRALEHIDALSATSAAQVVRLGPPSSNLSGSSRRGSVSFNADEKPGSASGHLEPTASRFSQLNTPCAEHLLWVEAQEQGRQACHVEFMGELDVARKHYESVARISEGLMTDAQVSESERLQAANLAKQARSMEAAVKKQAEEKRKAEQQQTLQPRAVAVH